MKIIDMFVGRLGCNLTCNKSNKITIPTTWSEGKVTPGRAMGRGAPVLMLGGE